MKYRKCVSVYYFLLFLIKTAVIRLTRNWSEISVSFDSVCDTFSSKNITKFKQPTTKREQQRKKEKKKKAADLYNSQPRRVGGDTVSRFPSRLRTVLFSLLFSLPIFLFCLFPLHRGIQGKERKEHSYIYIYTHRQIE